MSFLTWWLSVYGLTSVNSAVFMLTRTHELPKRDRNKNCFGFLHPRGFQPVAGSVKSNLSWSAWRPVHWLESLELEAWAKIRYSQHQAKRYICGCIECEAKSIEKLQLKNVLFFPWFIQASWCGTFGPHPFSKIRFENLHILQENYPAQGQNSDFCALASEP